MRLLRHTQACLDAAQRWPPDGRPWSGGGRARPKSIAVFESTFVDRFFARALPISPIFWVGPVLIVTAVRVAHGPMRGTVAMLLFAAGWLAWSFLEYLLHRFIFHMGARTPSERLRAFMLHGYHHEFPDDPMRLVAPPLMSWPIGIAVAALLYALIGPPHWLPMFAGMATGYLAYDWIHYYTHHFHPRRGIGKWLRSYHMLHHFQDRESRFGVSSPLWDLVFGTYKPVPHSDVNPIEGRSQSTMRLKRQNATR
jgi:sterol desaturase/sphingolipid hydroxylase (fatty acid hydroxylase superfamily)